MKRVLIVDDSKLILAQLTDILAELGFAVAGQAKSGGEAVRKAKKLLPDIVLMDIIMPGKIDGIKAAHLIRNELDIPVIFLTGHEGDPLIAGAKETGANGYLLKPVNPTELKAIIEIALYRNKSDRELNRFYREVIENTNDIVYVVDGQGDIRFANNQLLKIAGYQEKEEIIGKSFASFLTPQSLAYGAELFKRQVKGEDIGPFEFDVIDSTGNVHTIEIRERVVWKEGRIVEVHGIGRDVSERRKAEEALRESEEKYRQVVENAQEAIVVFVDGIIVYSNPMTETMTGYSTEELKGKPLSALTFPEDSKPATREFQRKLGGDSLTYPSEYRYLKRTGEIGWYEAIAFAITWGGKQGLMVFAREVTERKKLEEQFLQAQKMKAIGAMAGGIAHNFNNILVGIMGYSEYLLRNRRKEDPEYKALKTIFDGTLKASQLTRELLNLTRAGEYHLITGNLNETVERILPLITGTFDKSIEIRTSLADSLPSFEVDTTRLEQCLLNLCINARDAMQAGGTLSIETGRKYLDDDFVRTHIASQTGEHLVLSVSDTGTGMTKAVKDHLFEPFFSTKLDQGGTGMGLPTVYGTVRKHGGFITVYSEPGEGTTFNLYFPVTRGTVKDDRVADKEDHKGDRETILIIDDEQVVRELWAEYLRNIGYLVILAENGEEGISLFLQQKDTVDLIILDVIMPIMGGRDTLGRIREINPHTKILIASGYSEDGKAGEVITKGVGGFIQKPTTLKELSEKIRRILDGTK